LPAAAVAATLAALAPAAHAEPAAAPIAPVAAIDPAPHFELLDRGDSVEIIAHHIKAARTAVLPVRSRLVVPIAGAPQAKRVVPGDATVKLIELDSDDATRMLSVKLGFERGDVKALSRFAQAIQVGDDLHLLVPRKLPDGGVAPRLPEPTMPAAVPPQIAPLTVSAPPARIAPPAASAPPPVPPSAPVLGPSPDPKAVPPHAAPTAPPAAARSDGSASRATPGIASARPRSAADALATRPDAPGAGSTSGAPAVTSATRSLDRGLAADRDDPWSRISMYGALGLAAAGAGVWLLRRRRIRPGGPAASIEVIAQRSLGGKARIVWLSAGSREMIVSVTAQQVRMLGQWRKTESPAALPAAHTHAGGELRNEPFATMTERPTGPTGPAAVMRATGSMAVPAIDKPLSPAVSGLLRLRGRTAQIPTVPEDIAADVQADELWAKEILAATTGRAGGRS
jgi:flagellar biogenesis protein FliO